MAGELTAAAGAATVFKEINFAMSPRVEHLLRRAQLN
ncbi:MAG: hypothetical protein RLZZ348_835 [Actinomycetota bacterium]